MKKLLIALVLSLILVSYVQAQDKGSHNKGSQQGHEHQGELPEPDADSEVSLQSEICLIMGGSQISDHSYQYQGKTYYFCCSGCIEEFKKNPKKYISKVKEFNLEAYQFSFSPDKIVVKKGDLVRIYVTSRDVPHGVYIKEYGINISAKKGKPEKIEFVAEEAGRFPILCSLYCGRGHHAMKAELIVEE
mgnify:CR=1 FL=1